MTYFCKACLAATFSLVMAAPALANPEPAPGGAAPVAAVPDAPPAAAIVAPEGSAPETVVPEAAAPALDPAAEALRAELRERFEPGGEVDAFYAARAYAPLWLGEGGAPGAAADALIAAFRDAGSHALPPARYDGEGLAAALALLGAPAKRTPEAVAATEAELTSRFLRYATDIHSGLLEPRDVSREMLTEPVRPAPGALLAAAAAAEDMAAHLATLPPQSEEYARLRARYIEFVGVAATGAWSDPVPEGRTLRPGDRNARVAALRARLAALGDFVPEAVPAPDAATGAVPADAPAPAGDVVLASTEPGTGPAVLPPDPELYDPALEAAVRRFQERHGLNIDAAVGPATLAAINASPVFRAQQMAVNLERIRWFNRDLGPRYVWVNQAAFMMELRENGHAVFTSRVVIGKTGRYRTPEFSDIMEHMVVNPSWHVPRSIATEEILPQLRADPGYLAARGMRLSGGTDPYSVDWSAVGSRDFRWSISQSPGRGNALGRVKFMFPNDFAIYLHDTPSRSLFQRDVRAFSHGCVRVEKPLEFAYELLRGQEADPQAAFDGWLATGRERRVDLTSHVPVHLTYRTAWVDEAGLDQFRQDIYGRDSLVADAMIEAGVAMPAR